MTALPSITSSSRWLVTVVFRVSRRFASFYSTTVAWAVIVSPIRTGRMNLRS